jgi:hypothetical protein
MIIIAGAVGIVLPHTLFARFDRCGLGPRNDRQLKSPADNTLTIHEEAGPARIRVDCRPCSCLFHRSSLQR